MSLVWRCLRRYRWYCLTALLFVLLEANCELLLPTLMARMIDEGVRTGELGRVLELGGWMAVAALAGILCVLVRNFCSGTASQRFGAELRPDAVCQMPPPDRGGRGSVRERRPGHADVQRL